MSAIGFILLMLGWALRRMLTPTTPEQVMAALLRNGKPTRGEIISGVLFAIGAVLLVLGIAIKLWTWLP